MTTTRRRQHRRRVPAAEGRAVRSGGEENERPRRRRRSGTRAAASSTRTTTTTTTTTRTTAGSASRPPLPLLSGAARVALAALAALAAALRAPSPVEGAAASAAAASASAALTSLPPPERLRRLLRTQMDTNGGPPILMPCCYDGLTARLVARAGFDATFMTGFGVSGVRGHPDTQLVSYAEMADSARTVGEALSGAALELGADPIPCIADADTGYGNAVNAKRTVFGYARAGMAGLMIEDQVAPKRCGHVSGKLVVPFDEAVARVRAACDARDEIELIDGPGTGPIVLARTDALRTDGFDEAMRRCSAFREVGCDATFLEAPESVGQMREYCRGVDGPKLANMLEHGRTPVLPPEELGRMGYTIAAYPLTLLSASIRAMERSLDLIRRGESTDGMILTFDETKDAVGFGRYEEEERRYKTE